MDLFLGQKQVFKQLLTLYNCRIFQAELSRLFSLFASPMLAGSAEDET